MTFRLSTLDIARDLRELRFADAPEIPQIWIERLIPTAVLALRQQRCDSRALLRDCLIVLDVPPSIAEHIAATRSSWTSRVARFLLSLLWRASVEDEWRLQQQAADLIVTYVQTKGR